MACRRPPDPRHSSTTCFCCPGLRALPSTTAPSRVRHSGERSNARVPPRCRRRGACGPARDTRAAAPPIHNPFFFEAAILSRMRSAMTSRSNCAAGEPAVIITRAQAHPAFVALTGDKGLAGLALRKQRIEFLFEALLGGFASVDCAANPCVPPCAEAHWSRHRPALAPDKARTHLVRPKNRGPDQWASVISAIAVSDR